MKILITGASGLIGRRLTETLLSQSHQVTALTRAPERAAKLLGPQVQLWSTLADKTSLDGLTRSSIWPVNLLPTSAGPKIRNRNSATAAGS